MLRKTLAGLAAGTSAFVFAAPAQAQDFYLGQIILFGGTFCPRGSVATNGQLLSIAQNNALFALLGTTYGGDGQVTFGVPDLRSRVPIHTGQGPGLNNYPLGAMGGTENVTITTQQMPSHNHPAFMRAFAGAPNTNDPPNASPADFPTGQNVYVNNSPPNLNMRLGTSVIDMAGGSQPLEILRPYTTMRYCIYLEGVFPSQN